MVDTLINTEDMEATRQEILAAMRNEATVGPEPGEVQVGDEIQEGAKALNSPMIVSGIKGAGIAYIWDTRTGERSRTNKNMLPTQMTKRREDGSLVFTQRDPGIIPKRGQLRCMLHAELREAHPEYDRWGLALCNKANLASPQDVKSHMQMRHKREWATIEDDRIEREKAEDRQLQRQSAEATREALRVAVGNNREAVPFESGLSMNAEPVKKGPFGRPLKTS